MPLGPELPYRRALPGPALGLPLGAEAGRLPLGSLVVLLLAPGPWILGPVPRLHKPLLVQRQTPPSLGLGGLLGLPRLPLRGPATPRLPLLCHYPTVTHLTIEIALGVAL